MRAPRSSPSVVRTAAAARGLDADDPRPAGPRRDSAPAGPSPSGCRRFRGEGRGREPQRHPMRAGSSRAARADVLPELLAGGAPTTRPSIASSSRGRTDPLTQTLYRSAAGTTTAASIAPLPRGQHPLRPSPARLQLPRGRIASRQRNDRRRGAPAATSRPPYPAARASGAPSRSAAPLSASIRLRAPCARAPRRGPGRPAATPRSVAAEQRLYGAGGRLWTGERRGPASCRRAPPPAGSARPCPCRPSGRSSRRAAAPGGGAAPTRLGLGVAEEVPRAVRLVLGHQGRALAGDPLPRSPPARRAGRRGEGHLPVGERVRPQDPHGEPDYRPDRPARRRAPSGLERSTAAARMLPPRAGRTATRSRAPSRPPRATRPRRSPRTRPAPPRRRRAATRRGRGRPAPVPRPRRRS